ncbi:MAG: DUF4383 domain-containing protein [Actinomycetota bacterium]|nr:DUF4383 domain-containing protein [Actinomycetota bacterium]
MPQPTRSPRWLRLLVITQGMLLLVLGIAGLVSAAVSGSSWTADASVLLFEITPLHSLLLVLVGIASLLSVRSQHSLVGWSALQMAGFAVLYLVITGQSAGNGDAATPLRLDGPESFLHLVLGVAGFVFLASAATTARADSRSAPADIRR